MFVCVEKNLERVVFFLKLLGNINFSQDEQKYVWQQCVSILQEKIFFKYKKTDPFTLACTE